MTHEPHEEALRELAFAHAIRSKQAKEYVLKNEPDRAARCQDRADNLAYTIRFLKFAVSQEQPHAET